MIINEKSWHYKLAQLSVSPGGDEPLPRSVNNLCKYWRRAFLGFVVIMLFIIAGVIGSIAVLEPIVSTIMWLVTDNPFIGYFVPDGSILVIEGIILFFATAFILYGVAEKGIKKLSRKLSQIKHPKQIVKENGISSTWDVIVELYKSWKNKFCPMVTFKDPDKNHEYTIVWKDRSMKSPTYDDIKGSHSVTEDEFFTFVGAEEPSIFYDMIGSYSKKYYSTTNTVEYTGFVSEKQFNEYVAKRFENA
jgi:hypothetical protein